MLKGILLGLGVAALPLQAAAPTFQVGSVTAANGGTVVASAASCTLILATNGQRTPTGCVIPANTPAAAVGTCIVRGANGSGWTMSANSVNLKNGTIKLPCSSVSFSPASGTFPASGSSGIIAIGMTFGSFVAANCPAGTYSGNITLKVANSSNPSQSKTTAMAVAITVGASLTLANVNPLDFGTVIPGTASGTVVISPTSVPARSNPGNVVTLSSASTGNPASFNVTGLPNGSFTISLATTANPATAMTLDQLSSSPSGTGTLDGSGAATLKVGGTLTVPGNQAAGTYTGGISVTVTYN